MSDDKIMSEGYQKRVYFGPADAAKPAFGPVGLMGAALNSYAAIGKIASPISFADELRNRLGKTNEKIVENATEAKRLLQLRSELEASLTAISALTPPLQHKGGETEAGSRLAAFKERFQGFIKADLPEGYIAWEGGPCPAEISDPIGPVPYVELKFSDGDTHGTRLAHTYNWSGKSSDLSIEPHIIGYRIFSSSEADSGPRFEALAGDARIEPPISTLQASSGEGEIIVGEPWPGPCGEIAPRAARAEANTEAALAEFMQREGAVRHNGGPRPIPVGWHFEALTRGCGVWPMRNIDVLGSHWWWEGEEKHDTNIIAYVVTEDAAKPTNAPTEPAAYSPVNNADEPVTKPEADFFAQALIPVQSGIEFSVDGGPKQATGAAKLFGGIFAKRVDA